MYKGAWNGAPDAPILFYAGIYTPFKMRYVFDFFQSGNEGDIEWFYNNTGQVCLASGCAL